MVAHSVGINHAGSHDIGRHRADTAHLNMTATIKKTLAALDPVTVSDIVQMALSDHASFKDIERQYGLNADEVKAVMRHHLKPGSYKAWRKRVRSMRDMRTTYK